MSDFHGKVAVVTGAGSGIGRALAVGLAERGAHLSLSDVDEAGLAATAAAVEQHAEVHQALVDIADGEAVTAHADDVIARFGAVNQIYNNAGIAYSRPVIDSTYEDYERVLRVNLWGVIHGTKAFLPHLIASGDGHVVNVSSLNGIMAQPDMSHYCTSKFAVRGFTESLRMEMLAAGYPVRVTSVHPGGVKTNIAANALADARRLGLPVTPADEYRRKVYDEKFLRMRPERAAEVILDGVRRNRARVLVGSDAKALDLFVRAAPAAYGRGVILALRRVIPGGP